MSDFLRNLRSSHKKDKSDPRRNLDGHYYPKEDRRQMTDRRSNYSGNLDTILMTLQDILPELVDNTAGISGNFEKFISKNDQLIEAKIRQAEEITSFFKTINKILTEDLLPQSGEMKQKPTASYTVGTHYTKAEILDIIREMREKGTTFAIIAAYLRDKDIPTFSGRGEWHAQTIHRLCK